MTHPSQILIKNSVVDILQVPEGQVLNYGDHICFIAVFHERLCVKTRPSSKKQINKRAYRQAHKTEIITEKTLPIPWRKSERFSTATPM